MNKSKEEGERLLIWWKTPALTELAKKALFYIFNEAFGL